MKDQDLRKVQTKLVPISQSQDHSVRVQPRDVERKCASGGMTAWFRNTSQGKFLVRQEERRKA